MGYKGSLVLTFFMLFFLMGCESEAEITAKREAAEKQTAIERLAVLNREEEAGFKKAELLRKDELRKNQRIERPFNLNVKKLPAGFKGHDIAVVIGQIRGIKHHLQPPGKGEFETTSKYNARKKSHRPFKIILGDTDIEQHHLAFVAFKGFGKEIRYNADNQLFNVNFDFSIFDLVSEDKKAHKFSKSYDHYILDFGTSKKFSRIIKMPINEAKNIGTDLRFLIITTLKSPWYRESGRHLYAHVNAKQIWLFNGLTGDVIKKWAL